MVGTRKSLPSLALVAAEIPAELRIDGKSTLLGEKRDEAPKRVYRWRGSVYEATADTPIEWLTQEPERKKRRREPSPVPPPPPQPPQKRKKSRSRSSSSNTTTTTTATTTKTGGKKRKSTAAPSRAEKALTFDLGMAGAAEVKAAIDEKKEEAKKNGYRVQGLQDDELRDSITVRQQGSQQEDEPPPASLQLVRDIHAIAKLNGKIEKLRAKYEQMKQNGLSVDALKKRKRATEEPEDEDILPCSNTKRARHHETNDEDTTHNEEPLQILIPDQTDQDSFMAQLQAAANAAPAGDQERETRSQLDTQLRSSSPSLNTTARPTADRSTPTEEGDTSSSEVPPRRHASSFSMSISSGTSPSIHDAVSAPAITNNENTSTARSSRPNDHFGKQQPHIPPPELAAKNRGGQTLRWSIRPEDLTSNPQRAESLIKKGRLEGESKQARRRRVARELGFLRTLPRQEV